jgi:hypothetical protein
VTGGLRVETFGLGGPDGWAVLLVVSIGSSRPNRSTPDEDTIVGDGLTVLDCPD